MTFNLPDLNYSYNALEPFIDEATMRIHHTKHHGAYVNNLNNVLSNRPDMLNISIEKLLVGVDKLPSDIKQTVINNAGGHANHSLFWNIMASNPKKLGRGKLLSALNTTFGDFEVFSSEFTKKGLSVFGSGWVFLIVDKYNKLSIKRHSFQNSPLMYGNFPILALDVWEHAYYFKYQNNRADYIKNWWNLVDWIEVEKKYKEAISSK